MTVKILKFHLWLAILIMSFFITTGMPIAGASAPVALSAKNTTIEVAEHAEYILDDANSIRFADITGGALSFLRHEKSSFQFSFKNAALWIKCRINASYEDSSGRIRRQSLLVFDNASLGSITLYVPVVKDGVPETAVFRGGWQTGSLSQEFPYIYPAFVLPENMDDSRDIFIHVTTPQALQFRVTLYSLDSFRETSFILFLIVGLCMGILIAMLLSNIVFYVYTRDIRYLSYNLYVLFLLLWQGILFGLFSYFWPAAGDFLMSYITVFAALMMIFAIVFAIIFLDTKKTAPRHHILLQVLIICKVIIIILILLQYRWIANVSAYLTGQISIIVVFTAAVAALRSGFKPARYYLLAVGVFIMTAFIFLFKFYGIIPNNTFTMHMMLFGSSAEAILLSFALGYRIKIIQEEKQLLQEREKSLEQISITDELTGLFNRRFLTATLTKKVAEARRGNQPLSVLMIDVDHFKRFNDTYGHPEGDKVLAALGKVIREGIREEDIACRYGGEEFVAILHKANRGDAVDVAERIRAKFAEVAFEPRKDKLIRMTLSVGVASLRPGESENDLIISADQAMYRAKEKGRNMVFCLTEGTSS